jgi:murein DD-endopeptidase MepM/ murein hydrolase activator NlpD
MTAGVVATQKLRVHLFGLLLLLLSVTPAAALVTHKAAAHCAAKPALSEYKTVDVSARSNVPALLVKYGIARSEADAAIKVLKHRAGLKTFPELSKLIVVRRVDSCNAQRAQLVSLTLATSRVGEITVVRDEGGKYTLLDTEGAERRYVFHLRIAGTLDADDLETGLIAAGIPASVAEEATDSFTADDELPMDALKGAAFDVVYQVSTTAQGGGIEADLTVAELSFEGHSRRVYYYKPDHGAAEPLDEYGRPLVASNAAQFTNPVPEGKLSSPFGWRKHPVLHVAKFHEGVDFSAPQGTPVRAAADGVVSLVTTHRTYGRYVKISHSPHLETGYAHLSNFAPHLRSGQIVHKGDVIAYVGRTGLASGNHLLFEVLVDGKHVDPLANEIEVVSGGQPDAQEKLRFIQLADSIRDSTPVTAGGS